MVGILLLPTTFCLALEPNDTYYVWQQPVWNNVNAPAAWDISTGSKNVTVAVVDSGVDVLNKDLKDNIWTNINEIPDNGIDDDRNGFIDDVHGWNFIDKNNNPRNLEIGGTSSKGAVEHGTIIAGLIGAVGNNNQYGTGVNWQVQIMPLRAIESTGTGSVGQVIKAINYAVDNGADVISLSFVGPSADDDLRQALYVAYQKGVVVVAAAGNAQVENQGNLNVYPAYPVCFDNNGSENWILGVSSIDLQNKLSSFASFGNCVDLVAPGEKIFSTEVFAPSQGFESTFGGEWGGTSFSAPIVAGAAGLVKGIFPALQASDIIGILLSTANSIDVQNSGFENKLGVGRLNVGAAAKKAWAMKQASFKGKTVLFLKQNTVFRLDTDTNNITQIYDASRNQGRVISASPLFTGDGNKVVVLLQRDKFFYLRLINEAGVLEKEVYLPPTNDGNVFKKIKGIDRRGIVVEEINIKKKQSIFTGFSLQGDKVKSLTLPQADDWGVDSENNLVLAWLQKNNLVVNQIDWKGKKIHEFSWTGVNAIYDLKVGDILKQPQSNDQVVMLIRQGNEKIQIIADFVTHSYRQERFTWTLRGSPQLLLFDAADDGMGQNILIYSPLGGTVTLRTARGKVVKDFTFPSLGEIVY